MDRLALVHGYLTAEGYTVRQQGPELLRGEKAGLGETQDTVYVWVPSESARRSPFETRARRYLRSITETAEVDPQALRYFLFEGERIPQDFRRAVATPYLGVKILAPAQFFDTAMTWESGHAGPSATRQLVEIGREAEKTRVHQAFASRVTGAEGEDILPHLVTRLMSSDEHPLTFVVAPAGMGKSYMFTALFSQLYEHFMAAKRRLELTRRPLALTPEHIDAYTRGSTSIDQILTSFLKTEMARPLNREVFEWRILHSSAAWLIDGLDEVIARDFNFPNTILDLYSRPDATSEPRILITLRDSLLMSSPELQELLDMLPEADVLHLCPWERPAKATFAAARLGARATSFLHEVEATHTTAQLSSVPFYLSILCDQYEAGALRTAEVNDGELLDYAVRTMIAREYDKGLLSPHVVTQSDVFELLTVAAIEDFEGGLQGLSAENLYYNAEIMLPADLDENERDQHLTALVQLAVFSGGPGQRLHFSQDLIQQYLLAKSLLGVWRSDETALRWLGTDVVPQEWATWSVIADLVRGEDGLGRVVALSHQTTGTAFTNLFRLALALDPRDDRIRALPFSSQSLAHTTISDADLRNVNLDGCDLTSTAFINCNLEKATLRGAILNKTRFDERTSQMLRGASVGDLGRFQSIVIPDGSVIDSHEEAERWFAAHAAAAAQPFHLCAAAKQLQFMFGKYVEPNGNGRRHHLKRRGVLAGTRYMDPEDVLDAAVSAGYLTHESHRDRYRRPDGRQYSEMVEFRTDLKVTPGIRGLLDTVCEVTDCDHASRAPAISIDIASMEGAGLAQPSE